MKQKIVWAWLAVASLVYTLVGCGSDPVEHEQEKPIAVTARAAFTPIHEASVYNLEGETVLMAAGGGEVAFKLLPGHYYLELRDDFGNNVFTEDGRLRFAPAVDGAAAEIAPHEVAGIPEPLIMISVGHSHDHGESGDSLGTSQEALHTFGGDTAAMRARLVWEAARAMVGPTYADGYTWSTSATNASYAYVSEDTGAWNSVRTAYGTLLCCRHDSDAYNNYTPCYLTYGADNVSEYVCQNNCGTYGYHGGQCKAFMNLVAYRSGVYHGTNWAFKTLPLDSWITSNTSLSTYGTAQVGDLLRRPPSVPHAAITVRIVNSSTVVVMDSNWSNGYEKISSHSLGYSGSGTVSDLGSYRVLNCVYAGTC